jgi:hypothetical protein
MKKCIFLLLIGVALLSCRENPKREELIREYYKFVIAYDSLSVKSDSLAKTMNHIKDSLNALNENWFDNDQYQDVNCEWMSISNEMLSCAEYQLFYLDLQKSYRTLFDRNYFRIYKKELIKQGRIKE